jgi:hypothetical protein
MGIHFPLPIICSSKERHWQQVAEREGFEVIAGPASHQVDENDERLLGSWKNRAIPLRGRGLLCLPQKIAENEHWIPLVSEARDARDRVEVVQSVLRSRLLKQAGKFGLQVGQMAAHAAIVPSTTDGPIQLAGELDRVIAGILAWSTRADVSQRAAASTDASVAARLRSARLPLPLR